MKSAHALGDAVRRQREALGLRVIDLARTAGVGRRFVADLEQGKPTIQLGRTLQVLAALDLNVSLLPGPIEADRDGAGPRDAEPSGLEHRDLQALAVLLRSAAPERKAPVRGSTPTAGEALDDRRLDGRGEAEGRIFPMATRLLDRSLLEASDDVEERGSEYQSSTWPEPRSATLEKRRA
jgi:y4mF family transcriptional regulator